jgi:GNAT superfamily N-acetyltransferase
LCDGDDRPATSERIEGMDRPASALPGGVSLAVEPYGGDGAQWVVAGAEAEIVERYGFLDFGERGLKAPMFDPPQGAFVVARRAGAAGPPAGGVGVRALRPGVGQIRRLWVDPAWRGHGIARALMAAVEDAARALGLTDLRLGTGDRQPEAVTLYDSSGWERVLMGRCGLPVPDRHIWFVKRLGP